MAPRAALLSALLLVGCFPPGEGQEPPEAQIYFPVGLSVSSDAKHLFVVNSDFDLQYNQGTVQSWDLDELRARIPHYCQSKDDCADGEVCDIYHDGEAPADEVVFNGNVPSNWCVKAPSADGDPNNPCGSYGPQNSRRRSLYPGRCNYISQTDPEPTGTPIIPVKDGLVEDHRAVRIGAFATDVVRRSAPTAPEGWEVTQEEVPGETPDTVVPRYVERLFIPVRGDATLHWIDVDAAGRFECGQDGNERSCDDKHRAGDDADAENTRGDRLSPEPFGIDADEDGFTVLVSNQTSGAVSLFSHTRTLERKDGENHSKIRWDEGPKYVFRHSGLPERPMGVASLPEPLAPTTSGEQRHPGYLVSFRTSPTLALIRVWNDDAADPARPYTVRYDSVPIFTNSSGIDSRGLAIDAFERKAEEAKCLEAHGVGIDCARSPSCLADKIEQDPTFRDCLNSAAAVPLGMFVANRAPSSVVLGQSRPIVGDAIVNDLPFFFDTVPLDLGPSRVYVGEVINEQGMRERRIFIVCFDSRRVAIYDPVRQRIETEIVTGRGPHAFAVDVVQGPDGDHAYAYIGHFLDSYVGVADLDQRHHGQYGAIIASIGRPVPPRASK